MDDPFFSESVTKNHLKVLSLNELLEVKYIVVPTFIN